MAMAKAGGILSKRGQPERVPFDAVGGAFDENGDWGWAQGLYGGGGEIGSCVCAGRARLDSEAVDAPVAWCGGGSHLRVETVAVCGIFDGV